MKKIPSIVSIIMPNLNHQKYIEEAIQSILSQSYPHLELIIVDGGSTDGSYELAKEKGKKDSRIKTYLKKGWNVSKSFNFGAKKSVGDYLCYFHSDDIMCEGNLEKKVEILDQKKEYGFVHSSLLVVDESGKEITTIISDDLSDGTLKHFRCTSHFCYGTILFRRKCFEAIGLFDPNLIYVNDFEYWLRLSAEYPSYYLKTPFLHLRSHRQQLTHRLSKTYRQDEKIKALARFVKNRGFDPFLRRRKFSESQLKEKMLELFKHFYDLGFLEVSTAIYEFYLKELLPKAERIVTEKQKEFLPNALSV